MKRVASRQETHMYHSFEEFICFQSADGGGCRGSSEPWASKGELATLSVLSLLDYMSIGSLADTERNINDIFDYGAMPGVL